MNKIHEEFNKHSKTEKLPGFQHEAQSLRVIDCFQNRLHEPLNLTLEVRDGVVCHWGERTEQSLRPDYDRNLKLVELDAARREKPATLEGCVVRMADTISYLGRDFEDGCMAGLVTLKDLPKQITHDLGNTNTMIIGTLIGDLVDNSKGKDHLEFSAGVYEALARMKRFNNSKIYKSTVLLEQEPRIFLMLNELFGYFLDLLSDQESLKAKANGQNYYSRVFVDFLEDMKYPNATSKAQIVSDFIAGMTDNFAMACFEDLFVIQRVI